MNDESKKFRKTMIEMIELLGSPSDQLKYERDVSVADVPPELVCGIVDDLYHPESKVFIEAFSEDELKSLAELYNMVCMASKAFRASGCHSVSEIQKLPEWRSLMAFGKDLEVELKRSN